MIGKKFIYLYNYEGKEYYWNSANGGLLTSEATKAEVFTSNQFFTLGRILSCEEFLMPGHPVLITLIKYPEKKYIN